MKSNNIRDYIFDNLKSKKFKERNIFNNKNVDRILDDYMGGNKKTSFQIWQILNTELWFQIFIDKKFHEKEIKFKFST